MTTPTPGLEDDILAQEPIHVLLVDDNEPWAEFTAEGLEKEYDTLTVEVATNASDALQRIRDSEGYDCVVTDYLMPEMDGLELLERAASARPGLPFILVTGEGNEDVAADAISAGVRDYLIKEPAIDQTVQLAQRIRTAVRQHRLEGSIRESEERYRTVTEQSRDAIVIGQHSTIVFANQRFYDLLGYDETEIQSLDVFEDIIHPDDMARVRSVIESWFDDVEGDGPHEARIYTDDGDLRHVEFTGRQITYRQEPAVLVAARDVTARKRRERELRWERELNRTVQRAVIETRTQEDLEAAICEQLADYGYDLVWTGDIGRNEVKPRVVRGDAPTYIETVAFSLDDDHDREPGVWAARTGEPQFIDDLQQAEQSQWQSAAVDAGYRSGAGLPIIHEGITYGVLVVYDDRPNRFDETERTLLTELVATMAYAIHSISTEHALVSNRVVKIDLNLPETGLYLNDVVGRDSIEVDARITVDGTVPRSGGMVDQYVTVDGIADADFRAIVSGHEAVEAVDRINQDHDRGRYRVLVTGPTPESELAALGVVVRSTVVDQEGMVVSIEVPSNRNAETVIDRLRETYPEVDVGSVVELDRSEQVVGTWMGREFDSLTDKQANALLTAYHHGYFEQPRKTNATEVAEAIGVSHSTFLQHLRVAQQKLLDEMYGAGGT